MSNKISFDQSSNIKLSSGKARGGRRSRGGRNIGIVFIFIAVCLVISFASCAITYNWLNIDWLVLSPSAAIDEPLDENELMELNEELREQIGVLQAQIDQLEAQLEQAIAMRGAIPPGTGVTTTPQRPEEPANTTPGTTGTGTTTGTTTPPGDGGTTTPPNDGGTTTPPGDGGTTTPPNDGGTTTPPNDGGTTTVVIPQ